MPAKKEDDLIRVADSPASENTDGERKTVTALFADIKGSMELMESLDPGALAWARIVADRACKFKKSVEVREISNRPTSWQTDRLNRFWG